MMQRLFPRLAIAVFTFVWLVLGQNHPAVWKPDTDWGHWRLGQRADLEFLKKNNMTVTFGSGAPNFETVSRKEFDQQMEKAKAANRALHDQGYIVLRYLTSSLAGHTPTNKDQPQKDQIELLKFWNERWNQFADYIGPKPDEDPTTWITVRPDGKFPHYRYAPYGKETSGGFETWGCPNNQHFIHMMEGRVRAQAETGIDGSYIDWTQIAGETCYCKYCQRSFRSYLKKNLPTAVGRAKYGTADYDLVSPPQKRGDPFWMEWVMFRGNSVAEFHKHMGEVARKYNPNFMIAGNVFGGFGYGPIAYDAAGNMEMLGRDGDDFVYSEIQERLDSAPRKDENGTKVTNSPALKFLAAATHGKPVIIYATEITPPIFPNPTERCLSAMAQINIAEAAANRTVFREKRETPPGATAMYKFLAANESVLRDVRLYSNVGVVASLRQYLADELSFAFSTSRVLADQGISHVMVTEDDLLTPALQRLDLLIVPYLPLLSDELQQRLLDYAKSGKTLLVLGASGSKDQYGLPQKKIALAEPLGGAKYPEKEQTRAVGKGKLIFIPLSIPSSRFLIPMKSHGDYTTFGPTMADLFADIPEGYTRNRIDPELRGALLKVSSAVNRALGSNVTRLTQQAPYVEITSMLENTGKRMLVHVVNYDVTIDGTVAPARNLRLQVALPPGKTADKVTWSGTLAEMNPLKPNASSHGDRQNLVIALNEVGVYGLLAIDLK